MNYIPPMIPNLVLAPTEKNLIYPGFARSSVWGYRLDKRAKNELHWHTYAQIWYTLRGSYYHTVNGERHLLKEGDAAIILPYSVHAVDTSEENIDDTDIIAIYLSRDVWEKKLMPFSPLTHEKAVFEKNILPTLLRFEGEEKKLADGIFRVIKDEFSKKQETCSKTLLENVEKIFRLCALKSNEQITMKEADELQEQSDRIYNAVKYITQNFEKKIPLKELCKVSLMSERSFTNKFKATTGLTYHSYLKAVRISEAVTRLRDETDGIFAIARDCGFSNSGHFINTCARMSGMSPAKLRLYLSDWHLNYGCELRRNRPFDIPHNDE
ncbi:MAG: helix-turn-helix transcriptional regulator [Oscillospiraceae bacterium]|nr:helix-turn-helix transcriptional regulator [Oscillospiraceae bacterium]